MKQIPLGLSDFKKLIEGNYSYVDKTLLIEELFGLGAEVCIIPRPRRFGKTTNLSMLYYFFTNTDDYGQLFQNCKIAQST